ncbi:MAG: PD-(D/E)XK nuclease family protein [Fidelibacterota bacterium]|nr:MAG: PD-(D/E)XK nuclease family protein [Candidatus Neomarinimicrobiota bacterium]
MPSDRFSFSRLQILDQCPIKYRFIYLDGRPVQGESIESYLGSRLHEALEWLYRERRTGRNILFDDLLNQFRALWRDGWHGFIYIVDRGWTTDDYYQQGQRCLAGYYRRFAPFDEPVDSTEQTLTFDLADHDDCLMTAVLDRLDNHGAGWWSIHDYKSGKNMLTVARAQRDLQMKIYALALVRTKDDLQRVDVAWHFLRHGKDIVLENVQWNPKRTATMLRKRIDKAREGEAQPETLQPRESLLCNWCYYWDICPAKVGQSHPAQVVR